MLALLLFEHLDAFRTARIESRDIVLGYPVTPSRPLAGKLHVEPLGDGLPLVRPVAGASQEFHIAMEYRRLQRAPDFVLWLALFDGPEGPWPPASYIVFPEMGRGAVAQSARP